MLLPCTDKAFSNAIGAVLPATHANHGDEPHAYVELPRAASWMGGHLHAQIWCCSKGHQGRRCDLVDGPAGQEGWG